MRQIGCSIESVEIAVRSSAAVDVGCLDGAVPSCSLSRLYFVERLEKREEADLHGLNTFGSYLVDLGTEMPFLPRRQDMNRTWQVHLAYLSYRWPYTQMEFLENSVEPDAAENRAAPDFGVFSQHLLSCWAATLND